jgi:hypothetical protein
VKSVTIETAHATGLARSALRLLLFIFLSNTCFQAFGVDSDGDAFAELV